MNTTIMRADQLEARFERLLVDFGNLQQQVAGLLNQLQGLQGGNQQPQGGGGGGTYESTAVLAPGTNTGITVSSRTSAGINALPGTYTVYNDMGTTSTVSGKTIILSNNGDGTFTVVTQSCT